MRKAWIEDLGLWYSDEEEARDFEATLRRGNAITDEFVALVVAVVQSLHASGAIERAFGRPVPALIHDLEYREEVADVNRSANPPGLVAEFDTWVRSL